MTQYLKVCTAILAAILSLSVFWQARADDKVVVVPMAADLGISGYEIVTTVTNINPTVTAERCHSANCPDGKKVLGGGGIEGGVSGVIADSYPEFDGSGWTVCWNETIDSANSFTVNVHAICVKMD